jgi:tellurite resistance protein
MGLFDKVFGGQDAAEHVDLDQQESFLAIALAISASDGHISQSEINSIISYLSRMRMFENVAGNRMQGMFDRLIGILRRQGPGHLVNLAKKTLPHELRQTAFACAVDIALADGVIEQDEKALLEELQQALEVPENIALNIIQVMMIKNRG